MNDWVKLFEHWPVPPPDVPELSWQKAKEMAEVEDLERMAGLEDPRPEFS